MRPSLRHIEAFLAVAELAHFSRAAERLGLSQPALSQALRELEALLGLRLVDRTTRRVELTAAGVAFRDRASRALAELDGATAEAQGRAGLRAGRLRVAAPPFLAATVLPGVLAGFAEAHAGVSVTLSDLGTAEILAGLRSGRLDLAIGTFPSGLPDLDRRPILREALMLYAAPDHPLAVVDHLRWADIAGHPLIALTRDSGLRQLADLAFARAGAAPAPVQEVTQIATALALVASGLGAAVLPGYARIAPAAAGLVCRTPADGPASRDVVALLPRDRSPEPAALPFLDRVAAALRQAAPGEVGSPGR
ncbi:MAG: LysR family transcriptional regulator [Gemmobacter sp.]